MRSRSGTSKSTTRCCDRSSRPVIDAAIGGEFTAEGWARRAVLSGTRLHIAAPPLLGPEALGRAEESASAILPWERIVPSTARLTVPRGGRTGPRRRRASPARRRPRGGSRTDLARAEAAPAASAGAAGRRHRGAVPGEADHSHAATATGSSRRACTPCLHCGAGEIAAHRGGELRSSVRRLDATVEAARKVSPVAHRRDTDLPVHAGETGRQVGRRRRIAVGAARRAAIDDGVPTTQKRALVARVARFRPAGSAPPPLRPAARRGVSDDPRDASPRRRNCQRRIGLFRPARPPAIPAAEGSRPVHDTGARSASTGPRRSRLQPQMLISREAIHPRLTGPELPCRPIHQDSLSRMRL